MVDPVAHRLPDILSFTIGAWAPVDPQSDLFTGEWSQAGEFFRLDMAFAGLINPPGPLGNGYPFEPFRYGPNPLFGYVELDMDADVQTGGEFAETSKRYTGSIARFGGMPAGPRYKGRVAVDGRSFGDAYRSGEEFHLAFHGWQITGISPANDLTFDPGDTWVVTGRLLHRSHAYEQFSYACCQGAPGSYEPTVQLKFQHSIANDVTVVSLVYPLTNAGAAAMSGSLPDVLDGDASNQNSVEEALDDLVFSVLYAPWGWRNNKDFSIIAAWGGKNAADHLDPTAWELTLTVATSYLINEPTYFAWTDMSPDVVTGDVNGDVRVDDDDLAAFEAYLSENDGLTGFDSDGEVNGQIVISQFGSNFSLYDLNYNGIVDELDRLIVDSRRLAPADFDQDGDVDAVDFARLQRCVGEPQAGQWQEECTVCDLNYDGSADALDVLVFEACASGPGVLADVDCRGLP